MARKQFTQNVIVRKDLMSKSTFSKVYKVDRKTLDKLIVNNMLNVEIIGHLAFINITDEVVIQNALQYRSRNPRQWHKETPLRQKKKTKNETFDERMDREFEEFEREHNK
jgi:hypothetical protein